MSPLKEHIAEISSILDLMTTDAVTEIDVVLRLDANCTNAPEGDPLTIDLFDADDHFSELLHSFSVRDLITEKVRFDTKLAASQWR